MPPTLGVFVAGVAGGIAIGGARFPDVDSGNGCGGRSCDVDWAFAQKEPASMTTTGAIESKVGRFMATSTEY